MKNLFQIAIAFSLIAGTSCSKKAFEWAGTYRGSIPSNEKKETITVLNLQNNQTYVMQTASTDAPAQITETSGNFSWSKNTIVLKDVATGTTTTFNVENNSLRENGKTLTLQKILPESITEKYWKLTEIHGKPVSWQGDMQREPHIILRSAASAIHAHGGCNTMTGTYEIDAAAKRIRFSQMASTQMACMNMEIETELKKILETTDNYSLTPDGKNLTLNRARMAPLARFEIVYLR